jgi:uncharacterized protein (TIGR02588 family)
MPRKKDKPCAGDHVGKNALEWTVFGLSTVLVLALVGWLLYAATLEENAEVKLTATTEEPQPMNGWHQVPVVVMNEGGVTAAGVEVVVTAMVDGKEQAGTFTIDFVPKGGTRRGAVSFKGGQPTEVAPRVIGYSEP